MPRHKVVIIGGGPGGYEAALVAAQLGAQVTVVERDGLGGACVLADCVPSTTLIATSGMMAALDGSAGLGIPGAGKATVDAARLYRRVRDLACAQSADVAARLDADGVEVIAGTGRLTSPRTVAVGDRELTADTVLIAPGASPRALPGSEPDGERILTCRQLYDLDELPPQLIVVGSGVTGAEFASAYQALGSRVTLVSSRDRVLPNEDADAAIVVEEVFRRRGMTVLSRSRAASVARSGWLTAGRCAERTACWRWAWCRAPATWAWTRPGSSRMRRASCRWTGCPAPPRPASTRPATAPG